VYRSKTQQHEEATLDHYGTELKNFVSFYFTNELEDIFNISLRKGFEVCGMLEDVYLARKRNVNGGFFGFVHFCKVRDVDKLLKALNNVWFGDCKVVAKVASFDRFGNKKPVVTTKVEGEKIIEGEKRKMGEGKLNEGGNNNMDVDQVGAKGVGNVVGGKPVLEEVAIRRGGGGGSGGCASRWEGK